MSLRALVTGSIAEPVVRWTPKHQQVLEVRIHATASQRNKETGDWSDIGAPLWVSASFWDRDAARLAPLLAQGDRVSVEGTLVLESFQRRDGGSGISYTIRNPRFLGYTPKRTEQSDANNMAPGVESPF